MLLQGRCWIGFCEHVCLHVVRWLVLDVDETGDVRTKMMKRAIYVFCSWAHAWQLGQCQGSGIVLESLAKDLGTSASHVVSSIFHLLYQPHQRDHLSQCFTEAYVLAFGGA